MRIDLNKYITALENKEKDILPVYYSDCFSQESTIPSKEKKYCFIRLYNSYYPKGVFNFGSILKNASKVISDKALDGKFYTHANINYRLTDNFFGLNIDSLDQEEAVKIEQITHEKKEDVTIDLDKSVYSLFRLEMNELDYKNLKIQLNKLKSGSQYTYDVKTFLYTSLLITKNKAKRALTHSGVKPANEHEEKVQLNKVKKGLVCSTFVAFVLKNTHSDIAKWMEDNKISVYEFAPNTLTRLPKLKFCFSGKYTTYPQDVQKYIAKHPEFREYNK